MTKGVYVSKVLAIGTVVATVSAVAGIITMVIVYETQRIAVHPTPRPTFEPTTPIPTGLPADLRLPEDLVPEHYLLNLHVPLHTGIRMHPINSTTNQSLLFTGNSTVNIRCVQTTVTILLHSVDLDLTCVTVTDRDSGRRMENTFFPHVNESNFLEVRLKEPLVEGGNYSLFTAFEGLLTDNLEGLYFSKYTEREKTPDGESEEAERFLAASQMQPTEARKVFPCFDEPAMKATFDVTITHRAGTTALANGLAYEPTGEEWLVTRFQRTEKMSTYLLAFAVSEFDFITTANERVAIKTYARPEAIAAGHADYAANITGKILDFYQTHFAMRYPMNKLDQLALPDFGAEAMENWGLITYRESALLYEEGVSSIDDKEWIAMVIAHELAHQWYGNLVTMQWWNELWLSEGFATYFSYMGVDHIEPEWKIKELFVGQIQTVFQTDALMTSHPLSSPPDQISTPRDIEQMFDEVTYIKGAAVLRMLADYVTDRVFQIGLRHYLKQHQFGNTEQKDLWKSLQMAVDENKGREQVAEVMDKWTNQIGYPVVIINTTTGLVQQEHFLLNRTYPDSLLEWHIPIRTMKEGNRPTLVELKDREPVNKPALKAETGQWVLSNVDCIGYYRVNYNPENWDLLLAQLEDDHYIIPVINRGQLIDDAFNLARAKYVSVELALNSTRYLRDEIEYIPWQSALRNINYFMLMFDRSQVYGPMQAYLRKQVTPLYNYFKNDTDNSNVPEQHSLQYNQINAISVACSNGLPECVSMVRDVFGEWMRPNGTNRIHPNLRTTIYCQAVAWGGEVEWEFAWLQFQSATTAVEKDKLREALACTKKIWLLNRYLQYTLEPDKIRKMDSVATIDAIARNVAGQALAWNFVRANWEYISLDYRLGWLIDGVTKRFSTDFELQELKWFKLDCEAQGRDFASRALEQAIERTEANIEWVTENEQTILDWFRSERTEP
ncbi:alanyl (membrane) aminopeptidase-like b [Aplochiton taeniatus]